MTGTQIPVQPPELSKDGMGYLWMLSEYTASAQAIKKIKGQMDNLLVSTLAVATLL